jgi:hypothetical protein
VNGEATGRPVRTHVFKGCAHTLSIDCVFAQCLAGRPAHLRHLFMVQSHVDYPLVGAILAECQYKSGVNMSTELECNVEEFL